MFTKIKTDYVHWIFLISVILFLIEVIFFNGALIFFLPLFLGCLYIGRKRLPKITGKLLFWFGLISLVITMLSMITFRFLLLIALIYIIYEFIRSKQTPSYIEPQLKAEPITIDDDPLQTDGTLFKKCHFWFPKDSGEYL